MTDSQKTFFVSAIRNSKSQFRNRIIGRADDAFERLQDLHQRGTAGEFDDLSQEERKELKDDYDYNGFERDVFYLLKFMFLFTERWGREGETETDGCLVIPEEDGYFIASYDPKLTYTKKGYDHQMPERRTKRHGTWLRKTSAALSQFRFQTTKIWMPTSSSRITSGKVNSPCRLSCSGVVRTE